VAPIAVQILALPRPIWSPRAVGAQTGIATSLEYLERLMQNLVKFDGTVFV